jgi:hypothetical protein
MCGSSSIMEAAFSSRLPCGVSLWAAGIASIIDLITAIISGCKACSLGLRLAAIAAIFFTFAGCRSGCD